MSENQLADYFGVPYLLMFGLAGVATVCWFAIQLSRRLSEFVHWLRCKVIEWRLGRDYTEQASILSAKDGTWDTRYRRDFSIINKRREGTVPSKRVSRVQR